MDGGEESNRRVPVDTVKYRLEQLDDSEKGAQQNVCISPAAPAANPKSPHVLLPHVLLPLVLPLVLLPSPPP